MISCLTATARSLIHPFKKAYPIDPGLIPIFDRLGKANLGHALEAAVAVELERRGTEVSYIRTAEGLEVDFLARHPEGRQELIARDQNRVPAS